MAAVWRSPPRGRMADDEIAHPCDATGSSPLPGVDRDRPSRPANEEPHQAAATRRHRGHRPPGYRPGERRGAGGLPCRGRASMRRRASAGAIPTLARRSWSAPACRCSTSRPPEPRSDDPLSEPAPIAVRRQRQHLRGRTRGRVTTHRQQRRLSRRPAARSRDPAHQGVRAGGDGRGTGGPVHPARGVRGQHHGVPPAGTRPAPRRRRRARDPYVTRRAAGPHRRSRLPLPRGPRDASALPSRVPAGDDRG